MLVQNYTDQHVAVFGLGKSGISSVRALVGSGARVVAWDDNAAARQQVQEIVGNKVTLKPIEEMPWSNISALVLGPGVPLTHPKPHPVVTLAKQAGCQVIGDIELFYQRLQGTKLVGITGTNGKSTTTMLLGHVLAHAKIKAQVGGNVGIPVLDLEPEGCEWAVLEMSSYQLDLLDQIHFNVALWLNISPDHLDRHGGMQGYINAKRHIFDRQGQHDAAVIGVDDDHSQAVCDALVQEGEIGTIIPVSVTRVLAEGVSLVDGVLYSRVGGNDVSFALEQSQYLSGRHNAQNIAVCYAVCQHVGVADADFCAALASFKGLRHRMQFVGEKGGVRFVNDSKATNAEAASKALATYDDIFWIAGGVAKEGGIEPLAPFFSKIRRAYLIGQAQDQFAKTLDGVVKYSKYASLEAAVEKAQADAADFANKSVVLLSPACASFDQWPNFEARGDAFCKMVGDAV